MARDLHRLKKAVVERSQEVDLKGIVKRLQKGSEENVKREPSSRVSAIARSLSGVEAENAAPDFEKTDVSGIKSGPLSVPASFYSAFKGPLDALAKGLSGLPSMQGLRSLLDSAGISLSIEAYLALSASIAVISGLGFLLLFALLGVALGDPLLAALSIPAGIAGFAVAVVAASIYPSQLAENRAREIDRSLPFALRQLATQIKAGVSFYRALRSVAQTDYGVLSEEFRRVLADMANGLSTEDALMKLLRRTRSPGCTRS